MHYKLTHLFDTKVRFIEFQDLTLIRQRKTITTSMLTFFRKTIVIRFMNFIMSNHEFERMDS